MLRRLPQLLLFAVSLLTIFGPIVLMNYFEDYGFLAVILGLLFLLGMFPLLFVLTRFESKVESADYARRLQPVKRSVETCWLMTEKKELDYRHRLVQQLLVTLNVPAKPEAPLPTGTKVDAYMEFEGEDWYITIKRGLNNQKRLTLQGEIEDIILHAPRKDRDLWICVVIGISGRQDPNELAHFQQFCKYTARRSRPRVNIVVMPAIIPGAENRTAAHREPERARRAPHIELTAAG